MTSTLTNIAVAVAGLAIFVSWFTVISSRGLLMSLVASDRVWRRCCSTHNSGPQSRLRSTRQDSAMTGAQFEISIDGVPRTYRDQKDLAFWPRNSEIRNPNSVVG